MLYALHESAYQSAAPLSAAARLMRDFWSSPLNLVGDTEFGRNLYASADLLTNLTRRYGKPDWNIDEVIIAGAVVPVSCETHWSSPWVKVRRFRRDPDALRAAGAALETPAVLVVAPLSGHFATLLRGTVQTFLLDHDVYVTDWSNARDVPIVEGRFGFHDYIDTIVDILGAIGRRA